MHPRVRCLFAAQSWSTPDVLTLIKCWQKLFVIFNSGLNYGHGGGNISMYIGLLMYEQITMDGNANRLY